MSVKTAGGSLHSPSADAVRAGARDVFAGLVASIITIAYGLSFAALIFAPPLSTWLAYGIAATFITSAVTAAIVALRSSLPFAIAGPDPTTVAVTATLVSALMARLAAQGVPDDLLAPVAIIMAVSAALTGILLCALGFARAGGAIRFIPYPVIGGFLGATGCLMVSGAVRVITNHGIGISTLGTLLGTSALAKLIPAAAIAIALYLGLRRRRDSPYLLPIILLGGIAAAHFALAITGTSLAAAEAEGWFFKAPAAVGLTPTWDPNDLRIFPWKVLPALSGDLLAVMFVTAISTLLRARVPHQARGRSPARIEDDRRRQFGSRGAWRLCQHDRLEPDHAPIMWPEPAAAFPASPWRPSRCSCSPPIRASSLMCRNSCWAVSCSISAPTSSMSG